MLNVVPTSKARQSMNPEDAVLYNNRPTGVNKLGEMMKIKSVGVKLSPIYTNHYVQASAMTLLYDANVPDHQIMFISGHSSKQTIVHGLRHHPQSTQISKL